jgi:ATP-binding protein involved in chromosome partitioning
MFRKVSVPVRHRREHELFYLHQMRRAPKISPGGAERRACRPGEVPSTELRERSDCGEPVVASQPDSLHSSIYRDIARQVWAAIEGGSLARPAPKIVVEN